MSLRKRTLSGLYWAGLQQISGQLVSMAVSIVLARLLSPDDFGLMGMIYIFITVSSTLADAGMGASLIRMANPEQEDYSTVFHLNVFLAVLIYAALFFTAPLIAGFYGAETLKGIIRVYGLVFVFSAISSVQNTILTKNIQFKKQLGLSLPSTIVGGATGIALAASGYGVWSLVWSGVVKSGFYTLQLWFSSDWRPAAVFDKARLRHHFRFGIKLAANGLLANLSSSIYPFVIGKFFSPVQTGYFTQTQAIKQFPISTLMGPINKVAYPALVNLQSDRKRLGETYAKMESLTLAVLIPAMVFGIVLAKPLLVFLLSERWVAATPYLQIGCLAGIISVAGVYSMLIITIQGKSGMVLRINVIHKIFMLLLLAAAIPMGIYAVLWSLLINSFVFYIFGSVAACRSIGYSFRKLVSGFFRLLSIGAVTGAAIWGVRISLSGTVPLIQLAVCIPAGLIVYTGLMAVFERDTLKEIKTLFAGTFLVRGDKGGPVAPEQQSNENH